MQLGGMDFVLPWGCSHADVESIGFERGELKNAILLLAIAGEFEFLVYNSVDFFKIWGVGVCRFRLNSFDLGAKELGFLGFWSLMSLGLGFLKEISSWRTEFARNGLQELHEWGVPRNDVVGFEERLELEIRWICYALLQVRVGNFFFPKFQFWPCFLNAVVHQCSNSDSIPLEGQFGDVAFDSWNIAILQIFFFPIFLLSIAFFFHFTAIWLSFLLYLVFLAWKK